MKVVGIILLLSLTFSVKSQTLEESLTPICNQLDTAKTLNELMFISASFDMVTTKFPEELMSNYYSALSKAFVSYMELNTEKRDLYIDSGDKYFAKVKLLSPENEETYILAALLANARLSVDGGSRWKVYGEIFDKNMESAKAINPNNPRIYYLKGAAVFNTPKMFGGGAKKALEFFVKAKELFTAQVKTSVMTPCWGENRNNNYLLQCAE